MNFNLVTFEAIDNFDNMDYIRYKYQIDKNKHLLEISLTSKKRDYINNFIHGIANLYRINNFKVFYKNMMYKYNNEKIIESKLW